ncbi:Uncharacterised protein [Serratia fonticola]|nr:Uncharacterised protein [Serratia fonticola]
MCTPVQEIAHFIVILTPHIIKQLNNNPAIAVNIRELVPF